MTTAMDRAKQFRDQADAQIALIDKDRVEVLARLADVKTTEHAIALTEKLRRLEFDRHGWQQRYVVATHVLGPSGQF